MLPDNRGPIYLQIQEIVFRNILIKEWKEGDKIPSVREIASQLEVNPNTVMKSFVKLQEMGIIENKRGIGLFISSGAYESVLTIKKEEFFQNDLPIIQKKAEILGIDLKKVI